MTQPSLDWSRPAERPKQVADTSIAAYREIAPTLGEREALVLAGLHDRAPMTAYELFRSMEADGLADDGLFDLNAVRPRLTSLCDKGLVTKGEKRACRITGKTVYTFTLTRRSTHVG